MQKELFLLINERIDREQKKIIGHAMCVPYLSTIGGYETWCVDVLIYSDSELLSAVPLAESGRNVRDFVNLGRPVELQRSKMGQFYVVGLADRKKGSINKNTYSASDNGFAFSQGWRKNNSGNLETGNQNEVTPVSGAEVNYSYTTEIIPYSELVYGTTPYGATRTVRTP